METNHESSQSPSEPSTGTTRRGILKGTSLALPAIVTLHSGAALANSSAAANCTAALSSYPVCSVAPTNGTLLRIQTHCLRAIEVKSSLPGGTSLSTSNVTTYYQVSPNSGAAYFLGFTGQTSGTPAWRSTGDWSLVAVDANMIEAMNYFYYGSLTQPDISTAPSYQSDTGSTSALPGAGAYCDSSGTGYAVCWINTNGAITDVGAGAAATSGAIVISYQGGCYTSIFGGTLPIV